MLKAIKRAGVGLITLVAFINFQFAFAQVAVAQIAPTNSAAISGSVVDLSGNPVTDAKVTIAGPRNASTQTDTHGLFSFVGVPFGTYQISVISAHLGTQMRTVSIEGDVNMAIQYAPTSDLKTIASVRANANSTFNVTPASITQVSPLDAAFQGKTSWRSVLEQIPGIAQAGLGRGTYWQASLPDGPLVPMQISIDGALPYETAILLDNMPLRGTSIDAPDPGTGTNIAMYPMNAFGQADVVRGPGASSPSIVDSIGGSFVLHTPGTVSTNHFELSTSTDPYGGVVLNSLAAFHVGKLSSTITWGFNDSPGPVSQHGIPGYFFCLYGVNGTPFVPYNTCADTPNTCVFGDVRVDPRYPGGGQFNSEYGQQSGVFYCCLTQNTAWSQHSDSISLHYAFSPKVSAQVFYSHGSSYMSNPAPYWYDNFTPPPGYSGSLTPGNQYLSVLADTVSLFPIYQSSNLVEEKINAQIGRGTLQLAALQNRTYVEGAYTVPDSINVAHLWGGGTLNGTTPVIYNGGAATLNFNHLAFDEGNQSNNRDMMLSFATPLSDTTHAGFSVVQSYYNAPFLCNVIEPGFVYSAHTPLGDSSTTREYRLYIGGDPSAKTSLDLSEYLAQTNYHVTDPTAANSANTYIDQNYTYAAPRLGFVWRPSPSVAIRASAGGGFAQAPLTYLAGSYGSGNANSPISCTPTGCSQTVTNVNLRPETSFAFVVGTDVRLQRNTIVSLDFYRSNLYGQLYQETTDNTLYTGLPLSITQYGNLGESRYEGILADVHHNVSHGIYWAFSGGLTRGYVLTVPGGFYNLPGTCTKCTNLNVVTGINFNGTFAGAIPYAQSTGTFGYRWAPDKYVDMVGTYFGNNNTYYRPAFAEFDGHISYPLTRYASILLTARNITGVYDSPVQYDSPGSIIGVPAVSGGPYAEFGEMYGPRTVILTLNLHS